MKLFIGADHRGFQLKEDLLSWLRTSGNTVNDCGNIKFDPTDDFPDFTFCVADGVVKDTASLGIVICGSGGGVTIAANKVRGIRCAQSVNVKDVVHNRAHDDINVLAIGADFVSAAEAKAMIQAYIDTPFDRQDRFIRRLSKISQRETSISS